MQSIIVEKKKVFVSIVIKNATLSTSVKNIHKY